MTVEAYTVMHDHQGPTRAVIAFGPPRTRWTWGRTDDPGVLSGLMADEGCGRRGDLDADGVVRL